MLTEGISKAIADLRALLPGGAGDETPPLGLIAELVKAEIEYAGDYDYTQVSYKFTPDQLADFARRLATPQPPKPSGAVPLPERFRYAPSVPGGALPSPNGDWVLCDDAIHYGDAREAAGRADAVPAAEPMKYSDQQRIIDLTLSEAYRAGNDSKTFDMLAATRKINEAFAQPAPAPRQMTTQGEAVDPWATIIAVCEALDIDPQAARSAPGKPSEVILEAARKKFTGSQP